VATGDIGPQETPFEKKVVREYIPVQQMLEQLFYEANAAEVQKDLRPQYLTRLFDELSVIAEVKYAADKNGFEALMQEWKNIDINHGVLDEIRFRRNLKYDEWHERKRALAALRERLGMGTSSPDERKNLGPPLPMSAYHQCPENCPILVDLRKKRQRYE